ncbi:hypothetical protein TSH7_19915, partial [Azospirillum sp. TSH7]
MTGFKSSNSAARFCRAHDEVRNVLRPAIRRKQHGPASQRRAIHVQRIAALWRDNQDGERDNQDETVWGRGRSMIDA